MTTTISRPTEGGSGPKHAASDATNSPAAGAPPAPMVQEPQGPNLRPATKAARPVKGAPGGPDSPATDLIAAPEARPSRGPKTAGRHAPIGTRGTGAAGVDPAANSVAPTVSASPRDGAGPAAKSPTATTSRSLLDPAGAS